jgi:hypothetical protein
MRTLQDVLLNLNYSVAEADTNVLVQPYPTYYYASQLVV